MKKTTAHASAGLLIILSALFCFGQNTAVLLPQSGTVITGSACTVSVTSSAPIDSVLFALEYRSPQGTVRKKSLGTVQTPPHRMIFSTLPFGNQYFFGANLIASVYRSDDTIQIVNSPRVFLLPEPIVRRELPLYAAGNSRPVPASDTDSITVVRESEGITISYDIPVTGKIETDSFDPLMIILDPRLSRTPFPGSSTIIISVPFAGEPQLITSAEKSGESFTISRTGTPIHLKKRMEFRGGRFSGTVTVPDFLLGGKVPDSLGLNVIIPRPEEPAISFVKGEQHLQYSPILFPLFVKTDLVVQGSKVSPLMIFSWWLLGGMIISASLILLRRAPVYSCRSLTEPGSELIVLIEEHITNPDLTAEFLAAKLRTPVKNIHREIKCVTGKKLTAYIESQRIEIVKERLLSSNADERVIASDCGFKSAVTMEASFKKHTGLAPYQFRKVNGGV